MEKTKEYTIFFLIKEFHISPKEVLTQYFFFIFIETYTTNLDCHMERIELYITNQSFVFFFFAYDNFPLITCN